MRNLTKDIVASGKLFEMPLVWPDGNKFIVFDGNRRVTCLLLLSNPSRAPTTTLQAFFEEQRSKWAGTFPDEILCQVETDREEIDGILYRRHTGTQNGIGQSTWDDRMKATFVQRTGRGGRVNVADEIEERLKAAGRLPAKRKIPRSTMNRLLSSEPFRNRLGYSVAKDRFVFTHDEAVALAAMARVADDLASRRLVLGHIWDVDGKRRYLDGLEREGVLPTAQHALAQRKAGSGTATPARTPPTRRSTPTIRKTLIPQTDYGLAWPGRLQRHHRIWEELQHHLDLNSHSNAISVLFRVLLELAVENYIQQTSLSVHEKDTLAIRLLKVGRDLESKRKIDRKEVGMLNKFQNVEHLVSADTLNRYVHSPTFSPSPEHLMSVWDSLASVIVLCLKA